MPGWFDFVLIVAICLLIITFIDLRRRVNKLEAHNSIQEQVDLGAQHLQSRLWGLEHSYGMGILGEWCNKYQVQLHPIQFDPVKIGGGLYNAYTVNVYGRYYSFYLNAERPRML
jgi:hypothetical protein